MSHAARQSTRVMAGPTPPPAVHMVPVETTDPADAMRRGDRLRSLVAEHYASLWRFLRRLGVPEADSEDAAQKCLCVVANRIDDIAPGKDKAFLFGVALRVAKAWRRQTRVRIDDGGAETLALLPAIGPDAEQQLDDCRARALLDALLASLPLDLRTVFVLYELEELTMVEIARALELPMGTVASRLRRAREVFEAHSRRVRRDIRRMEEGR
jgi:RNA polymerase sigma-70 factor, ECF subfamily